MKLNLVQWLSLREGGLSYQPSEIGDPELDQLMGIAYKLDKSGQSDNSSLMVSMTQIDGTAGQRFQAHGLAKVSMSFQFKSLLDMLRRGFPKNLHSAPLSLPKKNIAGAGAGLGTSGGTAYDDGNFIVVSGIDKQLTDGIKYVIMNDAFAHANAAEILGKKFPGVKFLDHDQAPAFFNRFKSTGQTGQQGQPQRPGQAPTQPQSRPAAPQPQNQQPGQPTLQPTITQYLTKLGVRPEMMDVSKSRDNNYFFVRNRQTGKSISIPQNENPATMQAKAKSVFGIQ